MAEIVVPAVGLGLLWIIKTSSGITKALLRVMTLIIP